MSPIAYRGDCPAVIDFNGAIRVNGPGTVKYRFIRSDGAIAPEKQIYFRRAGLKAVETTWTLGGYQLTFYEAMGGHPRPLAKPFDFEQSWLLRHVRPAPEQRRSGSWKYRLAH